MNFTLYLFVRENVVDIQQQLKENSFNIININNQTVKNLIKLYNLSTTYNFETQRTFFLKLLRHFKINCIENEVNNIVFILENDLMIEYFNKTFSFFYFILDKDILMENLSTKDTLKFENYTPKSSNKEFDFFKTLFNLTIDKVYCITIFNREDRQTKIMEQSDKYNIPITFLKVKKNEDPVKGCAMSHLECIKDAKKNNYKNVLILEDDMLFDDEIIQSYFDTKEIIQIPENFNIFFLGYNANYGYRYDKNIIKLLSAQCAHSYILSNNVYDEILTNFDKDWSEFKEWNERIGDEDKQDFSIHAIDLFYAKIICHRLNNSYGLYPMISYQQPGYSDIENKEVDYMELIRNKAKNTYLIQKYQYPTLFLNLKKREDRLMKFRINYINEIPIINVFEAIDGTTFDFKPYLQLFSLNNFGKNKKNPYGSHEWKAGVLGCSMSHILMWNNIVKSEQLKEDDYILILEDDIQLCENFTYKLNKLLDTVHEDKKWDLLYLGYTDYVNTNDEILNDKVLKLSGEPRTRGGGTFGYFIRKSGASKLLTIVNEFGIQQAIDWFLIEHYDKFVAYKTINDLIFSKVQNNIKGGDSDVQNRNNRIKIIEDFIKQNSRPVIQKQKLYTIEEITEEDPVEEYEENKEEKNDFSDDDDFSDDIKNKQLIQYQENIFSIGLEVIKKILDLNRNNNYKQFIHKNKLYFKNDDNHLFNIKNGMLNYVGILKDNQIETKILSKNFFRHDSFFKNIPKDILKKETIVYFMGDKINYYSMIFCEYLAQKYNVIILGQNLYNIRINNIMYINVNYKIKYHDLFSLLKVKHIFIESILYFNYIPKLENQIIHYIFNQQSKSIGYKSTTIKNEGISFFKNYIHNIDDFIFYNEDEKKYFKAFYNLSDIYDNKFKDCSYIISDLSQNIDCNKKLNWIVCYDTHFDNSINLITSLNKLSSEKYKLVLFSNDELNLNNQDIIIFPRNEHNLINCLLLSKVFLTFETNMDTHFNITFAMNSQNICVVPLYYKSLKDICLTYSFFDKNKLNELHNILLDIKQLNNYRNKTLVFIQKYLSLPKIPTN